ncbi:MAG: hypothetical protein ACJ8AW_40425, partial [Rhodopila sp.]
AEKYEQARLDEMREQHEAHGLPLPDVEGVAEEPASTEQPQAAPAPRSVAAQPTQPTPAPQHVQQQPQLQAAREVALFTHPSSLVNYPI